MMCILYVRRSCSDPSGGLNMFLGNLRLRKSCQPSRLYVRENVSFVKAKWFI